MSRAAFSTGRSAPRETFWNTPSFASARVLALTGAGRGIQRRRTLTVVAFGVVVFGADASSAAAAIGFFWIADFAVCLGAGFPVLDRYLRAAGGFKTVFFVFVAGFLASGAA